MRGTPPKPMPGRMSPAAESAEPDGGSDSAVVEPQSEPVIEPRPDPALPWARICVAIALVLALGASAVALLSLSPVVAMVLAGGALVAAIAAAVGRAHRSFLALALVLDASSVWIVFGSGSAL